MIRQRGGIYQTDFEHPVTGKRVRKSLGTTDKVEAMQQAAEMFQALAAQRPAVRRTVADGFKQVWQDLWSEGTDKDKQRLMKACQSSIGESTPLDSVDRAMIEKLGADVLERGCSGATANRHMACVRAMLAHCEELGWIKAVPRYKKRKEPRGRMRYLSDAEVQALLDAEDDAHWRLFWRFLLATGMRLGDGLRAHSRHINKAQGTYYVRAHKTGQEVNQPHSKELIDDLLALPAGKLFPWTNRGAQNRWNRTAKKAGIEGATIHTLRHTCATRLLEEGADIREVQAWLTHSVITTTERYTKVVDKRLFALRDRLENRVTNGAKTADSVSHETRVST